MTSWPVAVARGARHRWRRSLQLRMVTTTLLLSAVVTLLIGVTILHQVQSGLLGAANRSALSQLGIGVERAQSQFAALPRTNPAAVETTALEVANELQDRNNDRNDDDYHVVMLSTSGLRSYTPDGVISGIPPALQRAVARTSSEAWTYTEIRQSDGTSTPGLVVGAPVNVADLQYQIFYLFPLTREEQTIALVERTMLVAGAGLVLLLAGIAALVTRQVVRPVRQAARDRGAARRRSPDERMTVAARTTWPGSPRRSTPWPPTCSARSAGCEELSRVQQRFVSDVSHELRTPMTTIRMAADLLHDARPTSRRRWPGRPSCCRPQLDRFESLLADLLEISRFDAGAAALEREPVDLRDVWSTARSRRRTPLAERRGSRSSRVEVPAAPVHRRRRPPPGRADPAQPRRQRHRARRGPAGRRHAGRRRRGGRHLGPRPRRRPAAGRGLAGLQPVLARRPGPRPHHRRHRTGPGHRAGGRPAARWLAAGVGRARQGSVFRLTLPWRIGGVIVDAPLPLDPDDETAGVQQAGHRG